jgi:hypothetical protein
VDKSSRVKNKERKRTKMKKMFTALPKRLGRNRKEN